MRREAIVTLGETLTRELDEARAHARRGGPTPAELELRANEAAQAARSAATERDDVAERARSTRERLQALERAIAEREGIPPAASALAAAGETLALSALESEPGAERAVAAALAWRASAVLASDPARGLELLERARREGLGSLTVVVGRDSAASDEPPVTRCPPLAGAGLRRPRRAPTPRRDLARPAERLLDARHGIAITLEGHGYDTERGELWFAGETAEALLLEMDARRRGLADEADELDGRAAAAAAAADEAAKAAAEAEAAYGAVAHLRERLLDASLLGALADVTRKVDEALRRAADTARRIEEPIAARLTLGTQQAGELGAELRRLSGLEGEAAREAADATARAQAAEVVVARLGGSVEAPLGAEAVPREQLEADARSALAAAEAGAAEAEAAADRARAADAALLERAPRRSDARRRHALPARRRRHRPRRGLDRAGHVATRLEAPVRARVDAGAARSARLGEELRRLGAAEVDVRRGADETAERATQIQVELARLDAESRGGAPPPRGCGCRRAGRRR